MTMEAWAMLDMGSIILAFFFSPCPEAHIVQRDWEDWDNFVDSIRRIPFAYYYLKENIDPE